MVNIDLLDQVLDDAAVGRFDHSQGDWFRDDREDAPANYLAEGGELPPCGTACCIAGAVAWRMGWRPIRAYRSSGWTHWDRGGEQRSVTSIARDELGLHFRDAQVLFWADNTLDQLREMRDLLAAGARLSAADWED